MDKKLTNLLPLQVSFYGDESYISFIQITELSLVGEKNRINENNISNFQNLSVLKYL